MLRVVRDDDRRSWGNLAARFRRRIDPNRRGKGFQARRGLHEALGMRGVRGQAWVETEFEGRSGAGAVDVGWGGISQPALEGGVVVRREQIVGYGSGGFDRTGAA